ncbi:class B acid phosphatase [Chlorobaculum sp. 24CR]|uniref:HAD family acid phosphatase n=1 Tax=Chlorobaculum sp. 24CR TaxID=2508878 RepID=UPI00100A7331|nr:HAD family acid phosphatase [Chlorobaculum sp. 24CR]RXK88553.1 class B acid phosphatase [Chlorobaculum sp. 24CR]
MTGKFRAVFALLYLFAAACTQVHYVTVEKIRATLPPQPIVAGFDIDDTVLFSSPGFYYGVNNHDGPGGRNRYPVGDSLWTSKAFWNDMNGTFDKFSIPKASGTALIQMHKQRGDTIVFITARDSSQVNIVPQILRQCFDLKKAEVIFTCNQSKTPSITAKEVKIYYGDSDTDITAAQSAKARPIRVLRSPLSTNKTSYEQVGKKGEEVLRDSEN